MFKNSLTVVVVSILLATAVNVYFFATGHSLTDVVVRTVFANLIIVLTLVPVHESLRLRGVSQLPEVQDRIKSSMKPVALYTLLIGFVTYICFSTFGEPLVNERMMLLEQKLNEALTSGIITADIKAAQLETAANIYSPATQVLVVLLASLFTGFVSSIIAAFFIRK